MKMLNLLIGLTAIGGLIWFVSKGSQPSVDEMRNYLKSISGNDQKFNMMSEQEVMDTYIYITKYISNGDVAVGTPPQDLIDRIKAISVKYNIFT